MRTENKNSEMMQALFEHFYNQKSLLFTIGGLLFTIGGLLENFNYRDSVPDYLKPEIEEIRNLVWVADTGTKQIDKIINEIIETK